MCYLNFIFKLFKLKQEQINFRSLFCISKIITIILYLAYLLDCVLSDIIFLHISYFLQFYLILLFLTILLFFIDGAVTVAVRSRLLHFVYFFKQLILNSQVCFLNLLIGPRVHGQYANLYNETSNAAYSPSPYSYQCKCRSFQLAKIGPAV